MTIRVHSYVNGVCKACGAVKDNDHIGPSWCSGRRSAKSEVEELRAEVERLTRELETARGERHEAQCECDAAVEAADKLVRERDEARANYAFMVERAANEKLDGYRELGARAAEAENKADRLSAQLDEALGELESLQALIREHLPYKYDDGEDDDASPEECVEYAAREIRVLKATNESLQQSFDAPDGGPMARAIARSSYHVEQQAKRKAEAERDEALTLLAAERSLGGRCQCGDDDVCLLARERDEARADIECCLAHGVMTDDHAKLADSLGLGAGKNTAGAVARHALAEIERLREAVISALTASEAAWSAGARHHNFDARPVLRAALEAK